MNKIGFFVFQIFFLSSIAHSEGTLVRPASLPVLSRSIAAFTKGLSGSGAFVPPVVERAADLLAEVGMSTARWLGSSALIYKLGRLFQQDLQNADEIEKEAEHRGKLEI